MTYWIGMGVILLIGYRLIKWSGRANEQANEGDTGIAVSAGAGELGLRSTSPTTPTGKAGHQRENEGYNGGEA